MTVTCSPGSKMSPSFNGRAVQTWPSSLTCPSLRATRSRTSALLPSSPSAPVVMAFGGVRRRRSTGRTSASNSTETTKNTAPLAKVGMSSSQLDPAAASAPPLSISKNVSPVSASAPASPKASMSQITAADMPSGYRVIGRDRGKQLDCETMWCPSATLSIWANAWLAGKAAPDDVLDALSCWAPAQSVTAYDAVAAGHTGLPWPDVHDAGAVSLLQTLRAAAGRAATGAPSIKVVLPVPGDVRALAAGEAVIVTPPDDPGVAVGLVPEFGYDESDDEVAVPELCALSWTVYSLPGAPVVDDTELGEAEYELRLAVRSAADALTTIGLGSTGVDIDDPRGLVEQLLESARHHQVPEPAPSRALRVLENAAHVDAIITVSAGLTRIGTQSLSEAQIATDALRPLAAVVRSARMAALSAILHAAWQS